ncbi:hypothetical protein [Mycobacteroides abscessus]|uniref:hypothetical protein n=1 Tax=Mycobacteroides abscessus TaxID=36809 RepID=UPI000C25C85A|nr:hypothetical protein [Mycobacteroides abscessus]RIR68163.1 hypothetical protein D2E62_03650 [Mycobacteroides abscessus]
MGDGRRARRQLQDYHIQQMGEMYAAGNWTYAELAYVFDVGTTVIKRSLDYYNAHLKPTEG